MSTTEPTDFGATLRAARERRGLTVQQLSEVTKISPSMLTALEDGQVERLPGGIFVRSFVRSYAAEVGLDPEKAVESLLAAFPAHRPVTAAHRREELVGSQQSGHGASVARAVVGVVVLGVIVAALLFFNFRGGNEPGTDGGSPVADVVTNTEPPPRPRTGLPPLEGSPLMVAPVAAAGPPDDGPLTVAIHPTGPCWLSVTVDGEPVFQGVLGGGEREVYEVEQQMVLDVGDAGLFEFSINDLPGRRLGDAGEMVTVEIERASYLDFVMP